MSEENERVRPVLQKIRLGVSIAFRLLWRLTEAVILFFGFSGCFGGALFFLFSILR